MAVTWKPITMGPATNNADYVPLWDGANTNILKDGLKVETTVGSTGSDTSLVTEQGIREAIAYMPERKSGTSEGTGADQEISHGFSTTWTHLKIELIALEAGVVFSSITYPEAGSLDHFHVTVTSGKDWAWVAESW